MRDGDGDSKAPRSNIGWTQFPNELLEQLGLTELSPLQFKILLVVYRYSIGFNRRHCDRLTLRGIAKKVGREWSAHFREACRLLEEWNMIGVLRPAKRRVIIVPVTEPWRWRLPQERRQNLPTPGADVTGEELERAVDQFFGREVEVILPPMGQPAAPNKEPTEIREKDIDGRVRRFATERAVSLEDQPVLQRIVIEDHPTPRRHRHGRQAIAG